MSHINFNILHSPRTKHAPAHSPPLRFAAWKPQPCQNLLTTYDGAPLPAKCPQWLSPCSEENGRLQSRSEEHTSELQSRQYLVCRLLLEKKKTIQNTIYY